jgi:nitroreductase
MASASLNVSQLVDSYNWRYAVKKFDSSKRIDTGTWTAIEKSLVLTPSSFGLQPWKFVVISSPENKAKLPAISWNQTQPGDCSHMVVFAARKALDEAYLDAFLASTAKQRNVPIESLVGYRKVILGFLQGTAGRHLAWSSNQAYIALGQLLASAAMLGVDACPMEGILAAEYDKLLGLEGSDYTTVVGCALGYRHPEDHYAALPKVRFDASEMISHF